MAFSAGRCPGVAALILVAACGSSSKTGSPDARVATVDASLAQPDAPLGAPDAAVRDGSLPDARTPDAPAPVIDAPPVPPDAMLPDAMPAPPDATRPDAPVLASDEGLVLGSVELATFVIETASGRRVFQAQNLCSDVVRGDRVTFASPVPACFSNTFKDKRTGDDCAVFCPTEASESGTVLSVTNGGEAFDIRLFSGEKHFVAQPLCSGTVAGDEVTFIAGTGSCFSNTFIDLASQTSCHVLCP